MRFTLFALCALLLACHSPRAGVATPANTAALVRDTATHNAPNRERRLRISLDSAMILVEVTSEAATVELYAPCGTFVDPQRNDSTLARWAERAEVLSPPAPDSARPDTLRYSAIALGGAKRGPYDNTTFSLIRLDTATSSSYMLRSTNTAWDCEVKLGPEQAGAFFGALRGKTVAGAVPFELPALFRDGTGRPHVSGAWVAGLDRQAQLASTPHLKYPKEFLGSGVKESVRLQFIVDSTGKVRPSSVRLIGPARPAFANAAVQELLAAEYRPAERQGRPVPTLVVQDFVFSP